MIQLHLLAVLTGCLLDFCFGDPRWLWHPVCAIGTLIGKLEKALRGRFSKGEKGELLAGRLLVFLVLLITGGIAGLLLTGAYLISPYLWLVIESVMCYQMMAWRSLRSESMKVLNAFKKEDVEEARTAVSMIVGRDTKSLSEEGITKATIETVAENASDGVIAPLLSMIFFGGIGICLYKAVNTMDSMIGYKNDRYLWFGRAAARLDDVCNFMPSRISAGLMMAAGYLCQLFCRQTIKGVNPFNGNMGVKIFKRDRFNHKSPNSAQTESVCAGVLQIELAGNAYYFGKLYEKPTIGNPVRQVECEDIRRANEIMTVTYLLVLAPVVILLFLTA
jgi:adenosylcobinamide-phosphate synthase